MMPDSKDTDILAIRRARALLKDGTKLPAHRQRRYASMVEALVDVATGFVITMIVSACYYYFRGVGITLTQISELTLILTVIAIARKYYVRRIFNKITDGG